MKYWKLPKDFATRWVEALRSGKYKQGHGTLVEVPEEYHNSPDHHLTDLTVEQCKFCCLGVGCYIEGGGIDSLYGQELDFDGYLPKIISGTPSPTKGTGYSKNDPRIIIAILTSLNDCQLNNESLENIRRDFPKVVFPHPVTTDGYNFSQIADFIEANFEFVDDEITK